MLIKKTFNTIHESQWQTLKDVSEKWGIDHLFRFKTSPLSIDCINGNKFLAKGCDDHQSIKSTQNPSHAWCEEMNQLSLEDFITVVTTLRADKQKVKLRGSLNPEFDIDFEDHWLWKTFIAGKAFNGRYVWQLKLPDGRVVEYIYTLTHTTYRDNKYVAPERAAFLEMLETIDPYYYRVFTLGLPGRRANNAPFAFAFDRAKHLALADIPWQPAQETYLAFDFNKQPISCSVWQYYPPARNAKDELLCIEAIKLHNSDIYALCDYILMHYPGALFLVTGDATGANTTALVQDDLNFYTVIKQKLNLGAGQLKVPSVNPPLKENQVLVNAVLALVAVKISPVKAKHLIFDLENVRVLPDGTIEKRDRNDPAQQADVLDGFRYLCNTFFKWVLRMN